MVLKQKEFVDIAAHELRTPIQVLSGNFELIETDIPSLLQNSVEGMEATLLNKYIGGFAKGLDRLLKVS